MSATYQRIHPADLPRFVEHLERQFGQSGVNGQPIFQPFEEVPDLRSDEALTRQLESLNRPFGQPGWMAAWAATRNDLFVGHITTKGAGLAAQPHRAVLGLGVEQAYQGQGIASRLLECALEFAKSSGLQYLDLRVFAHNFRAIQLYERFGFKENGRIVDCFRVHLQSIDDVLMTLDLSLSPESPHPSSGSLVPVFGHRKAST